MFPARSWNSSSTASECTLTDYVGVGLSQGMQADSDGAIEVTIPVKAGSHMVGVTFLATNYRPSLDMIRQYERKSLENNSIPQLQYYPAIGLLRIQGPFNATRPEDSRSMRKVFTCQPASAAQEEPCAKGNPFDADAARLSASRNSRRIWSGCGAFTRKAAARARLRTASNWRCGESWRARNFWCAPKKNRPTWRPASPIALPTWNWPRVCPSSCGAAFRTTS